MSTMTSLPTPTHTIIDQRDWFGDDDWAWRHELSVRLPIDALLPNELAAMGIRVPPQSADVEYSPDGPRLVVALGSRRRLLEPAKLERMQESLAEAWETYCGDTWE